MPQDSSNHEPHVFRVRRRTHDVTAGSAGAVALGDRRERRLQERQPATTNEHHAPALHPHTAARFWLLALVASVIVASLGYAFQAMWLLVVAGLIVLGAVVLLATSVQGRDVRGPHI
jgi:Flp pilus assembly protein TadB